jgi:hypothetical protein
MPWLILGDFNLMRSQLDKNTQTFRQDEADAFNTLLNDLALIEIPLIDRLCTWSSNRTEPTCTSKRMGGLGVRNLHVQNICLLLKFCYKTLQHQHTPWKTWITNLSPFPLSMD